MPLPTVFVSYSHKDEPWKKVLLPQLEVLVQEGLFEVWEDRRIDAGDSWYPEIRTALEKADAAVCLISAHYLSSPFVRKEEVPFLLEKREKDGLLLLPVLLSACPWKRVEWLKPIEMLPRDGTTVDGLAPAAMNEIFAEVAERIAAAVERPRGAIPPYVVRGVTWSPAEPASLSQGSTDPEVVIKPGMSVDQAEKDSGPEPEEIDLARLPVTGAELFGRGEELRWLDELWDGTRVRIAILVAWGGVGKSTLVNRWLERMRTDGFRGARKVFGWTFFSQGTGERVASADFFFGEALRFFGDPDPDAGSPWAKGERLAELVGRERNLLVLDGLEPLQSAVEEGRLQDPGLAALLTRLAQGERGFCLITTREPVIDLDEFPQTAVSRDLEQITPEAGRALLRVRGIRGSDAELEQVTRDFGGHALAVNLLASYLKAVPGPVAQASAGIPDLPVADERSRHSRRILEAFARHFGLGPELELLLLLGLFDRPAAAGALAALRAAPAIPGITDYLAGLSEADWLRLLAKLRGTRLLAEEDSHQPDALDAHPLVREHFGEKLARESPEDWRTAHGRLYEYYKRVAAPYPDTAAGLSPLFVAVSHGCKAGRYQEALNEVYWDRILRQQEFFSGRKVGAWGANLQALLGFVNASSGKPLSVLSPADQAFIAGEIGFSFRSLGRLQEALKATKDALEIYRAIGEALNSSWEADNVAALCRISGDLRQALSFAELALSSLQDEVTLQKVNARAALANLLHQRGELEEAERTFKVAEEEQRLVEPVEPFLYLTRGFKYCELLLDLGQWQEVERRARHTLQSALREKRLREIALDRISLGRAHLLASQQDGSRHLNEAKEQLDQALEVLRQAGQIDQLLYGFLARAELLHLQGHLTRSRKDLEDTLRLSTRCGMRLFETDAHLGFARLHLASGERDAAFASLDRAKQLIAETGYHRRDRDVAVIEAALD